MQQWCTDNESGTIVDSTAVESKCQCPNECTGEICFKKRAEKLVKDGHLDEARNLLEGALKGTKSDLLRSQLLKVYQSIVSENNKRPIAISSKLTLPSSSDRHMFTTDEKEQEEFENHLQEQQEILAVEGNTHGNDDQVEDKDKETVNKANTIIESVSDIFTCVICSKLLFQPVSTSCGHSFCRLCLCRAIGYIDACPMCRTAMHLDSVYETSINMTLQDALQTIYQKEYEIRRKEVFEYTIEEQKAMRRLPVFPLDTVCFPTQRFPMHIFEERYRLMLRRVMKGSRKFGIVHTAFLSSDDDDDSSDSENRTGTLCKVGCVVEVTKTHILSDGRSLIDTVGCERFEIQSYTELDGYIVADAKILNDNKITDNSTTNDDNKRDNSNDGQNGSSDVNSNDDNDGNTNEYNNVNNNNKTENHKDETSKKKNSDLSLRELEKKARIDIQDLLGREDEIPFIRRALQRAGHPKVPPSSKGPGALGLWIASLLVVKDARRQKLLEMRDSELRLREMVDELDKVKASFEKQTSRRECPIQ